MHSDARARLPVLRPGTGDLDHLRDLIQDTSTRPVTTALRSPFAVSLAIPGLGHPTVGPLADHRIELFPLLSGGEKLILVASHEDVDLWTCQDDSWCLLWLGKAEDWSVGAIERDIELLLLGHI